MLSAPYSRTRAQASDWEKPEYHRVQEKRPTDIDYSPVCLRIATAQGATERQRRSAAMYNNFKSNLEQDSMLSKRTLRQHSLFSKPDGANRRPAPAFRRLPVFVDLGKGAAVGAAGTTEDEAGPACAWVPTTEQYQADVASLRRCVPDPLAPQPVRAAAGWSTAAFLRPAPPGRSGWPLPAARAAKEPGSPCSVEYPMWATRRARDYGDPFGPDGKGPCGSGRRAVPFFRLPGPTRGESAEAFP